MTIYIQILINYIHSRILCRKKCGILRRHVTLAHFKNCFLSLMNSIYKDIVFEFVVTKQKFGPHLHKQMVELMEP